jgi:hypothetical protein
MVAEGNGLGVEGGSRNAPGGVVEGKVKSPGLPAWELIGFQSVAWVSVSRLAGEPTTGEVIVGNGLVWMLPEDIN